jgi:hypothetical protein
MHAPHSLLIPLRETTAGILSSDGGGVNVGDGRDGKDCHAVLDRPQSSNVAGPRRSRAPSEA